MVLYKRKLVEIPLQTTVPDDDTQVWFIPTTDEFFVNYNEYLERLDFYNQKKFICELTGHSCLTFFEAFDSERIETDQVIKTFPESLKEPILRMVQFSEISRLDALVDSVYGALKKEFYPGEVVIARVREQRLKVIIREKAKFNSITLASGEVRPAYSRYRVEVANTPGRELAADESQLTRDRKKFTKVTLRTFIKYAVSRESWAGAPWIVKDEYAKAYRIDQQAPIHLHMLTLEHKKMTDSKLKRTREETVEKKIKDESLPASTTMETIKVKRPKAEIPNKSQLIGKNVSTEYTNGNSKPIIKEDLEYEYSSEDMKKPKMKTLKNMENPQLIRKLLEIWAFLYVYHEPLVLSKFSFDDFVDLLWYADEENDCVLLDEIHCSLLNVFMGTNSTQFKVSIPEEQEEEKESNDVNDEANSDEDVAMEDTSNESQEVSEEQEETNKAIQFRTFQKSKWTERLRKRMYADGGWQQIIIAFFSTISFVKEWKDSINEILDEMASLNQPVSLMAAFKGYYRLSFAQKVQILSILLSFTESSDLVRNSIDRCLEESVKIRREKTECQRQVKILVETIRGLEEEKKVLENKTLENKTSDIKEKEMDEDEEESEKTDEISEKHVKSEIQTEEYQTLCEKQEKVKQELNATDLKIKESDESLARLDVQRVRCLGKDRYYNRYWWFELEKPMKFMNGSTGAMKKEKEKEKKEKSEKSEKQPNTENEADDEDSSQYAMGRLWIQGPEEEDLRVKLSNQNNENNENNENNKQMSLMDRKKLDEWGNMLLNADDWRFYDTKEEIESLIDSLNRYGSRESRLLYELKSIKKWILASIEARQRREQQDEKNRRDEATEMVDEEEQKGELYSSSDDDDDEDNEDDDLYGTAPESADEINGHNKPKQETEEEEDDDDEDVKKKKRRTRSNVRLQKLQKETTERHHKRKQRRKETRKAEIEEELRDRMPSRVLDWTNQLAIDKLGHLHYDSYKRTRSSKMTK